MSQARTDVAGRTGSAAAAPGPRRWIALLVVLTAAFMQLVDISIVNVAIPSIQRDLNATYAQIQWVLAGYQLAFAVVLITGGRLGDIYGRKRLFMIGMAGFTTASALCGLAQTPGMLVGARVLQGAFGAIMFPQVLSVIQVSFPPAERGKALGVFGAVLGLATIAGPLVGGLLIQGNLLGLDWRPIFLVNVPIGVVALIAAGFLLGESKAPRAIRLDPVGVVIVSAGLLLLIYPLVEGRDLDWPTWSFAMMAASVPLFVLFGFYERWKKARDGSPLVEPHLFTQRAFVAGLAVSLVFFSGIAAFFLPFTIFLQIGLGFSALHAGLTTLPFAVGSALASGASIRLAPRLGRRVLSLGALLLVVGMVAVIVTIHRYSVGLHSWQLLPALLLAGMGLGCTVAPLVNVILAGIHGQDAGSASGVLTTTQQVGGALGVAIIGVIFFGQLATHAAVVAQHTGSRLRTELGAAGVPAPVANQVVAGFQTCFQDRSREKDPSAEPPSCTRARQAAAAQAAGAGRTAGADQAAGAGQTAARGQSQALARIGPSVAAAADAARKQDFADSIQRALLYEVLVFSGAFLLIFLLPDVPGRKLADRGPAAAA